MRFDPEEHQKHWAEVEPSNLHIIGAYAPSDHLQLFEVGNTASEKIHILAASRDFARIIAMMGGHIRTMRNATFWQPTSKAERGSALYAAIRAGLPGRISIYRDYAIMRDRVFYSSEKVKP